jgi:DNA repair exonuclease SbcCD ATPase subunit
MRLTRIEITNLAAFPSFAADLPCVAIISGRNGLGKSSLLNVIKYAFGRRALSSGKARGVEHDPRLLHGDAEKGEATITFDDGSQLRVTVTKDSTERMVKSKDSKRWLKSSQEIDAIANALSYDPLQFKAMAEKERVETLLRIMTVTITQEELSAAVNGVIAVPTSPTLETINALHANIYALRADANRETDTLTKHATELERALPAEAPNNGNWAKEVERLTAQKDRLDAAQQQKIQVIGKTLEEFKAECAKVYQRAVEEAQAKRDADIEAARGEANKQAAVIKQEFATMRDGIVSELATAQERDRAGQQSEGTRLAVKQAKDKAQEAKAVSEKLTAALNRLAALKGTVAARLPIKGITIASAKPGLPVDICRIEDAALVPFSVWNDADKDTFCLRVAVLSRGPCGLVCIDSIADFDPERKKSLRAACEKYAKTEGLQFLLGLATGGPLKVSGGPEAWEEE